MKVISTTQARKQLSELINLVRFKRTIIGIGRHNKTEALLVRYPEHQNADVDDVANIAMYGGAFDFLEDEPDLYSLDDLEEIYV